MAAIGLLFALATAFSEASKDVYFSGSEIKKLPHLTKAWVMSAATLTALTLVALVFGIKRPDHSFWLWVGLHAVFLTGATVLYMRALARGASG